MSIRIVTDSTCDLPAEVVRELGITVIPLFINIEGQGYRDGVDISRQAFYEGLPAWHTPPTTAAPGPETFRDVYDRLAEEGAEHVVSIHISSALSATLDTARLGAQMVHKAAVTVLDSRQLSLGLGFVVQCAAQAAKAGRSLAAVLDLVEDKIQRAHVFAALETLEFLRRSGRMNGFVARLGTLLQIKPILKMYNGSPVAEKVRTSEQAMRRMIGWLEDLAPLEMVALVHTNAAEKAEALRQRVAHLLPAGLTLSVNVTPVIGAHLGPGAVGFAVVQAKR